ncbi:hypothetical protein GNY06_02410 [Elizabethkingia argentiflava]|uniref:Fibrobacter succinogenes major paralogous domain-containing protein n=1 Tax=Elizabethkingia argenteiflava TaxID=2681556 RepID=A0A845PRJ4_9FLAO|nr:FISUMP domain-containing protein [Elizabethkingia argenteiflava]NAW50285.1 hypothetical protein [Elizabethkingia argenteiflava]
MQKQTLHNRKKFYVNFRGSIPVLMGLLLGVSACRSSESDAHNLSAVSGGGVAQVKFNVLGSNYDGISTNKYKALSHQKDFSSNGAIQRKEVDINERYYMEVELVPQAASGGVSLRGATQQQKGEQISTFQKGNKYQVAAYDTDGKFVDQQELIHGKEGDAKFDLPGGKDYTFVSFSVNSQKDLPPVKFEGDVKALESSVIKDMNGSLDFMYFKKTMQVVESKINFVDVVFKHKFSEVVVNIDAQETEYPIAQAEAIFDSHYPTASIELANGEVDRSGKMTTANVSFPNLGKNTASSSKVIINGETETGTFTIKKLVIGENNTKPLTMENVVALKDLKINPGVRYDLNLTIHPKDRYLTHKGIPAALIGGQIWMRHNVGADFTTDPDKPTKETSGKYYQWGRKESIAGPDSFTGALGNWNIPQRPANVWNLGTETEPVKNEANDPCPEGYRVPTSAEFDQLEKAGTWYRSIGGAWATSQAGIAGDFSKAGVLVSRRKRSVFLTFPAPGYRSNVDGSLKWRAGSGTYWSSSPTFGGSLLVLQNEARRQGQFAEHNFNAGYNIRCIAEK